MLPVTPITHADVLRLERWLDLYHKSNPEYVTNTQFWIELQKRDTDKRRAKS